MVKMKIKERWKLNSLVNAEQYTSMYKDSLNKNDSFWNEHGKRLLWRKQYTKIKKIKYSSKEVDIKWYYDGTLNVSENCIDRHVKTNPR